MDDPTPTAIPPDQLRSASRPNGCIAEHEGNCAACGDEALHAASAAATDPGSRAEPPPDGVENQKQPGIRGTRQADAAHSECSLPPENPLPHDAVNGLETVDEFLVSYGQTGERSLAVHGRITWVDGDQGNALLKNQGRALRRVLTILAAQKALVPDDSPNDQAGEPEQ